MESEVVKEKIHTEPMLSDPRYITLLSVLVLILTLRKYIATFHLKVISNSLLLIKLTRGSDSIASGTSGNFNAILRHNLMPS